MVQGSLSASDLVDAWSTPAQEPTQLGGAESLTSAWRSQQPLGFLDAMQEVLDRPIKLVPFLSGASDAIDMKRLYDASVAMQHGRANDEQRALVYDFLEQSQRPRGVGYLAGSILAELPAFAGEFAITGGMLPAGKKVATETVGAAIAQAVKRAAIGTGKAAIQLGASEAISQAAGAVLYGEGGSRVEAEAWRRALPGMQLSESDAGKLDVVFSSTARDFYDALPAAIGSQLIEFVSERSGEGLMSLTGLDRIKLGQSAVARWFLGKHPEAGVDGLLAKVAEKAGWHGVVSEYLEERFGGALKAATLKGEPEFGDIGEVFPGIKQQAAELMAFSAVGGVGAALDRAGRPAVDTSLVPAPKAEESLVPGTVQPGEIEPPTQQPKESAPAGAEPGQIVPSPATETPPGTAESAATVPATVPPPAAPIAEGGTTTVQEEPQPGPRSTATPTPQPEAPPTETPTTAQEVVPPTPPGEDAPVEPWKPGETTGIRNFVVTEELKAMGLIAPEAPESVKEEDVHKRAKDRFLSDPDIGQDTLTSVAKSDRPPTYEEDVIMGFELNRLINARDAAELKYKENPTPENEERIRKAQEAYQRAAEITTQAGTKSGRSLAFRKMMLARDYSLAHMELQIAIAKGEPLTRKEIDHFKELSDRIAKAEAKLSEYVSGLEKQMADVQAEAAVLRAARESARGVRKATRTKTIEKSKKRIEELLHEFVAQGQRARSGAWDPELLATAVKLAAEHIRLGYTVAAQFVDEMVSKLGDAAKPYAEEGWRIASESGGSPKLKAYKTRKRNQAADLARRIRQGDFGKVERKHVELDKEAIALQTEVEELKHQYTKEHAEYIRKHRTGLERVADYAKETLDLLTRGIAAGVDLASLGYQAGPVLFSEMLFHPSNSARIVSKTIRSMSSERSEIKLNQELKNRALYDFSKRSGLVFTGPGMETTKIEEALRSNLSDKIPALRAFNRAFRSSVNEARMTLFESMVYGMGRQPTLAEGKDIARFVNMATGRAYGAKLQGAFSALRAIYWAPSLVASRFQMVAEPFIASGRLAAGKISPEVAKAEAKFFGRYVVGLAAIYAALAMAAAARKDDDDDKPIVEWDPRSSDFMQVRFGKTRVDPTSGLRSAVVMLARTATQETKSVKSRKVHSLYRPPYGKDDWYDVLARFNRTKLAPAISIPIDLITGTNVVGEAADITTVPARSFVPMSARDIFDSVKEDVKDPTGYILGFLGATLFRISTYE